MPNTTKKKKTQLNRGQVYQKYFYANGLEQFVSLLLFVKFIFKKIYVWGPIK